MKKFMPYAALVFFMSIACHAEDIPHIIDLSSLEFIKNETHVTAPYELLSETTYTKDLNIYAYKNHLIHVSNKDNPQKLHLHITKNVHSKPLETQLIQEKIKFPWWSKFAPKEIQSLDFSKVDGKKTEYEIGDNYRLTLLSRQGWWGMVYVLEYFADTSGWQNICAVKLLLTRTDKPEVAFEEFRRRHHQEIDSNVTLDVLSPDITIKPYGIIENDLDHYLLFMEYGENAHEKFKNQSMEEFSDFILDFIEDMNAFHATGYVHGDLKVDNMLFVKNKIKLCDFYSLSPFTNECVGTYRYWGDYLPPEAMRALYFRENNSLVYAKIGADFNDDFQEKIYILHPIAADRFCLGISLLEIMAPDLYQQFKQLLGKDFNAYRPESLDFWQKHVSQLKKIQNELLLRTKNMPSSQEQALLLKVTHYIDVDPWQRHG